MALTFRYPLLILIWPVIAFLTVYLAIRRPTRSWLAIITRWLLMALLVTAASEPALSFESVRQTLVILADQSASLGETGREQINTTAQNLLMDQPDATLLAFGAEPWPVQNPVDGLVGENFDELSTDIEAALNLAERIIGSGKGRIVLLSDGQETTGNAEDAAKNLASMKIPIDIWFVPSQVANADARVAALTMPSVLYRGQIFDAEAEIISAIESPATLRLTQGEQLIAEREVTLTEGLNIFRFQQTADREGIVGLTLEVIVPGDTSATNNYASAVAQVYPSPRILMVSNLVALDDFRSDLQDVGFRTDLITPADLPTRMSEISNYQALFLIDVGANDLSVEQMALIESFVQDEGQGLVTTGGAHSYILGGDKDTPLESIRPLEMEPPQKPEDPTTVRRKSFGRLGNQRTASVCPLEGLG